MSRVLVTGAGDHLGHALANDLLERGHDVVCLSRRAPLPAHPNASHQVVQRDLADGLEGLPAVDWIVHAAAATHLDPSLRAADYAHSNICGTLAVLEHARRSASKGIMLLSTLSVYGRIDDPVLTEDYPPLAPNLYGRSKRLAEEVLLDTDDAFDISCLRLPGVTGPGDHRSWLGRCLLTLYRDEPLHFANGDASFNNIIDVGELSRLIAHLLARPAVGRRDLVNVGAETPLPVAELLTAMRDAAGSRSPLIDDGPRSPCFRIDTAKLREQLGFIAADTLEQALGFVRANVDANHRHPPQAADELRVGVGVSR